MKNRLLSDHALRFGYTQEWMVSGFLTEKALLSQVSDQAASGDSNYEHFRYDTLISWIRGRASASDEAIANFAELVLSDPDKIMAGSALADLIDTPWITDGQFEFLAPKMSLFGKWTEKRILRAKTIRGLVNGPWNQDLFEMALAQKDMPIHERLLLHPKLSRSQLERLAELGANRGIRSRAAEALKSNRFRDG